MNDQHDVSINLFRPSLFVLGRQNALTAEPITAEFAIAN